MLKKLPIFAFAVLCSASQVATHDDRVRFQSDWDTALGNSDEAIRDGGRWTWHADFSGDQLMTVVSGGPAGHNALRVQQRGQGRFAFVQKDDFKPVRSRYRGRSFYVRFYMKNDDTYPVGDHIVTPDFQNYQNWTYMRRLADPAAGKWKLYNSSHKDNRNCLSHPPPVIHWSPANLLNNGEWYRFEYHVEYVTKNRIQVHPRVYDAAGVLLYDDDDFQQSSYGSQEWNGRSDWTLASFYAAGYDFCHDPHTMNDFGMGNNGQTGTADPETPQYWYFAAVEIQDWDGDWPGPVQ
jgi:hypothetical protein